MRKEQRLMYYHGHTPAHFTIEDSDLNVIDVERRDGTMLLRGGVLLDGMPIRRIQVEKDGSITLMVTPPDQPSTLLPYHLNGYQFWEILHDKEEPNKEYTGVLEAQLVYIRQLTGNRDEDQPRVYHVGGEERSSNRSA